MQAGEESGRSELCGSNELMRWLPLLLLITEYFSYKNRYEADLGCHNDGIMAGRYILIEYEQLNY